MPIERPRRLEIDWQDGHRTSYDFVPPALALPVRLLPWRGRPARLARLPAHPHAGPDPMVDIQLVGNYAVCPSWADGHHTGYYTFALLRDRCPCPTCAAVASRADRRPSGHLDPRPAARRSPMIVATTPYIAGHRVIETKGQTFGARRPQPRLLGNLIAGLRSLGGGEIHEYTQLLEDTRRQALDRLVQNATLMGANAVISMRFDSSRDRPAPCRDRGLRHGGRSSADARRASRPRVASGT